VNNPSYLLRISIAALCVTAVAHAQARKKSPTSKIYVADTQGETQIDTGSEIDELTKRSVYNAEGTAIQTKPNSNASLVLSNGTGIYFDVNTRVEIRTFQQDSFRPNRSDIEDEPSISRTHMFLDYGVIGISTSKLVAGSTMQYDTSLASAWIRGRQAVISASDNLTVISMVQGDATVQAGPLGRALQVKNGQQILVRPGKTSEENITLIQNIPDGDADNARAWLNERVLTADAARKLVYFEVQARKGSSGDVTLFDEAAAPESNKEIVPVAVVPVVPPLGAVVSAANLSSP
jgi:hypothetical protein